MRSRELLLVIALLAAGVPPLHAAPPTREQVEHAAEGVRRHPDLPGQRKERTLRSKPAERKPEERRKSGGMRWLADLLRWISESARMVVWFLGALAVALLVVGLRRWMLVRGGMLAPRRPPPPSHVQSLDIRPESLPRDIGAAAARLWEAGEHRAALSLLYRGALSRLVHGYGVAIRAASTEGECVALAQARLDRQRSAFFARLVAAWQLTVYAARMPDAAQALALCREFDAQLPAPAAVPQGQSA